MIRFLNLNRSGILLLLFFMSQMILNGQEGQHESAKLQSKNELALSLGATFIPIAGDVGTTEARGLFVPTVGLNYFYHINPKWKVGITSDLELDHYVIVDDQVERNKAVLLTVLGMYNINDYWSVFAGGGIELEQHQNLAVVRAGAQYTIHLKKNWVIVPKIYFDFIETYDAWSFSVSFGKKF